MITGLHHFSIIASSSSSVEFYSKLGFKEIERIKRGYDTVVLMEGCGIGLEIFIDPRHPKRNEEPLGMRSLSLSVEDIETAAQQFDAEIMLDWHRERYIKIKDPDGTVVQLHE